jgi:hypothetical protein
VTPSFGARTRRLNCGSDPAPAWLRSRVDEGGIEPVVRNTEFSGKATRAILSRTALTHSW